MMPPSTIPNSVPARWAEFRGPLAERYPYLAPFFHEAHSYPKLRALFPFLSIGRLCLSRCTRYPYFVDFMVCAAPDGQFSIQRTVGRGGWAESVEIAFGDAPTAARLLDGFIPADYGPAIEGTGDDIRPNNVTA
jgi:Family of unknown function (DUF6193)